MRTVKWVSALTRRCASWTEHNYNFAKLPVYDIPIKRSFYGRKRNLNDGRGKGEGGGDDELTERRGGTRSKKKNRKSQNTGALVIFTQVAVKSPRGLFIISPRARDIFRNTSVRMRAGARAYIQLSPRVVNYRSRGANELIRERERAWRSRV